MSPPRRAATGTAIAARTRARVAAPVALASGLAWLFVALGGSGGGFGIAPPLICSPALLWSTPSPEAIGFFLAFVSPWSLGAGWLAMIVAMMLPTTVDALVHVRERTLRRLRPACLALFLLGYVGVWMLAGAAFLGAAVTVRLAAPGAALPLAGAAVAAVWQVSPWKQTALNRCHRRPSLAAFAPAACRDALAHGGTQGLWCLASCWALMLAVALVAPASHLVVMALVTILIWTERLEPATRPRWSVRLPGRTLRMISRIAAM